MISRKINRFVQAFLVFAPFVYTYVVYYQLPDPMPIHFNLSGEPDGWTDKSPIIYLIPFLTLCLAIVSEFISRKALVKTKKEQAKLVAELVVTSVIAPLSFVQFYVLGKALETSYVHVFINLAFAAFLLILGAVIGRLPRNFWVGIRIPGTLSSAENWKATHRFAGKCMLLGGLLILISAAFVKNSFFPLIALVVCLLLPVAYSFRYSRRNRVSS